MTRFNRQMVENIGFTMPMSVPTSIGRDRRFSLADVEVVIDAPEFFRDGDAYFTGVWRQAEKDPTPHQTTILSVLAQSQTGLGEEELAGAAALTAQETRAALDVLRRHDVVTQLDGRWRFAVELMRRWVLRRAALC